MAGEVSPFVVCVDTGQQEIVVLKGQMVERMNTVCSHVEGHLRPVEETSVRFVKRSNVLEACRCLGSVVRYGRFKTTCNKTTFYLCNAGSNAPISSKLVTCKLSPVADPTVVFWSYTKMLPVILRFTILPRLLVPIS